MESRYEQIRTFDSRTSLIMASEILAEIPFFYGIGSKRMRECPKCGGEIVVVKILIKNPRTILFVKCKKCDWTKKLKGLK